MCSRSGIRQSNPFISTIAPYTFAPTPRPSSPCEGNTPDWVDNYGSGCEWYERVDQPGCPTYGNTFTGDMGPASETCCYCMMTTAPAPTPPEVEDFTFVGRGWCVNEAGNFYDYDTVDASGTVEECAAACKAAYGDDETFVGINYLGGDSDRGTNCNCMKDFAEEPNGQITGGNNINAELCYSFDGPSGVTAVA